MNITQLCRRHKHRALPLAFLGIGVAAFLLLSQRQPAPLPGDAREKVWPVTVQTVAWKTLRPALRLYGVVESPRETVLSASVAAEITKVRVLAGQEVKSGDVLVEMDDGDLQLLLKQRQADVAEANASIRSETERYEADQKSLEREDMLYQLAQKSVERMRRLAEAQSGSWAQLDDARGRLQREGLQLVQRRQAVNDHEARLATLLARKKRAEALHDQVLRDIERTTVRAPFDGRITAVHVSPANRARVGDSLVAMFDTSLVEVRAQIPDRDLPGVRRMSDKGQEIRGTALVDDMRLELVLHRLSANIRQGQGGVDALFRLQADFVPALGRVVELTLMLAPEPRVIAAPRQALYGQNKVFKVADGKLKAAQVRVAGRTFPTDGDRTNHVLVYSDELSDGDRVVISPLPNAVNGLPVRVVETGATEAPAP
ncbi:MAG: biotin/lipoyl-binding protein [Gammaproteobacteria bacterium]|nr:biotin/lipoyl-binding protein [Gammaproteobacteria bacterium]